ncbi:MULTISPECIES: non-hydrolyzing UDP-N-acetylglucosamine 2-epimerase [Bacillus]|uniref:UDP-N-acetylglucosamine 2-epimerase (Non-hydrolyzing) n=1 Tax=Bacillus glycinifermentans TaxID=1664069 RepID=A0AAJ4D5H4_9BACI|nr:MULTISPECIES: UDP-N-acetylglucosamine 2-epimerase (non-hydrolyzing) [Bacillus]KKB75214.1 UDP-N-acetylglucosamine 2-epimerase [Bacillus sp. TH008]MDU0071661.1 UDP-N-acetylglucosamine 2-epimerase (non-hydrolyzing) [Bacillus sp. IG6]MED8019993.1 UDP-N-acetylglucosamine 2-epimerase (non-hydrolyzing) [Bacillus glycinifermentans]QAT68006.1 UDP-N-acetylglucosamine 2-epimerase (non-hydrolyzing) [Bacillus glycinifermentans]WKB77154.1 UDP-N-acetylglucosamine 2-epimerase (non-hydrolyzing) [Bacillus gl
MKIMTILGTRPEIIRLSLIIGKLDQFAGKHILVHTGQNYDASLSEIFFDQLKVRLPDYHIKPSRHSTGAQIGEIFTEVEKLILKLEPDKLLVLGDTNSALCAFLGERYGIPVYHMEAGNRCFDNSVPEEINRRVIDSIASFNLPYTRVAKENLEREGMHPQRIWVSGNPIYEVMNHYRDDISKRKPLDALNVQSKSFILVTAHRAENVDHKKRLQNIVDALASLAGTHKIPVICSVHPRTRDRLQKFGIQNDEGLLKFCEPFGFFDFVNLQQHAKCVITDSGTVQEESCILKVPSVTIRNSTERPETVMCGSNVVSGLETERIVDAAELMMQAKTDWELPEGYDDPLVSDKIVHFILGGLRHV